MVKVYLFKTQKKISQIVLIQLKHVKNCFTIILWAPSPDELAAHFYVSKYYLLHQFKEYTKTTIHQYILMKRINLAKDYLESGFSPTSIYEKCGFSTYSNFYKAFTGQTGISPGNYKR